MHGECKPAGIFTCRCPGDNVADMAKILKAKGADFIHLCTCTFSKKTDQGWTAENGGFCSHLNEIITRIHNETGLQVVKGTAHLPKAYSPEVWEEVVEKA